MRHKIPKRGQLKQFNRLDSTSGKVDSVTIIYIQPVQLCWYYNSKWSSQHPSIVIAVLEAILTHARVCTVIVLPYGSRWNMAILPPFFVLFFESKVGKGLFSQIIYLQNQWIDFKNLKCGWKLKRSCITWIELIFKFLSWWVLFSVWILLESWFSNA